MGTNGRDEALRAQVRACLSDPALTYRQRLLRLAGLAESALPPPSVGAACLAAQADGVVHDSVTGYPVYLGDLDTLLEPFADGLTDADLDRRLTLFWRVVDRTMPDAFVHADLVRDADVTQVADGARHASTFLGAGAITNQHLRDRVAKCLP